MNKKTLMHGDCLERLKEIPDCSVDSVVTDPPYGLSFMGKKWDYDVPSVEIWQECLRVLKPGGHLLAFAGTRTQHRMAVRIEDAGFEIRDMIAWVYGSGFPKSLDVSKAIDKQRTEDTEPVRAICRVIRAAMDAKGLKSRNLVEHFNGCHPRLIDHWAARDTDSQPALPTWDQWVKLREVLDIDAAHDAEVWRLNGRKGQPGDAWQSADVVGVATLPDTTVVRAGFVGMTAPDGVTPTRDVEIKAANSDAARQWQGWGTALKPALEPITVARKPLIGTVAANVLEHGTGGLNIDGCRVLATGDVRGWSKTGSKASENQSMSGANYEREAKPDNPSGRWPANLIHDGSEEVLTVFPQSGSGNNKGAYSYSGKEYDNKNTSMFNGDKPQSPSNYNDKGSAARFFYCAKASKRDRDEGLDRIKLVTLELESCESNSIQQDQSATLLVDMETLLLKATAEFGTNIKKGNEWSTVLFGNRFKEQFQEECRSTTLTETNLTIESKILNALMHSITSDCIPVANLETENGGSRAVNAESCNTLTFTISEKMALALGVSNVQLKMLLKISVKDGRNIHSTVKPTDLMRYLCRLVTPPNGTVLDPFMGSGSTGKAAMLERVNFIGIEREEEYIKIAEARIEAVSLNYLDL